MHAQLAGKAGEEVAEPTAHDLNHERDVRLPLKPPVHVGCGTNGSEPLHGVGCYIRGIHIGEVNVWINERVVDGNFGAVLVADPHEQRLGKTGLFLQLLQRFVALVQT